MRHKSRSVLPGFGLSLGITCTYLSLMVLLPLATVFTRTADLSWAEFWGTVTNPRVVASYRVTFGASFVAALVNTVFGLLVAWVLVRYRFPGPAAGGRHGGPAVRAADGGGGHRAHHALRRQRVGRAATSSRWASRSPTPGSASRWP